MNNPHRDDGTIDAMHERNARLVVRLGAVQRELHLAAQHPTVFRYERCRHESCVATARLVQQYGAPRECARIPDGDQQL